MIYRSRKSRRIWIRTFKPSRNLERSPHPVGTDRGGYFVGPAWHARFCRPDFGLSTRPCNAVSRTPYRRPAAPCGPCVNWPTMSIVIQMRFCAGGERRKCPEGPRLRRYPRTPNRERLLHAICSCVAREHRRRLHVGADSLLHLDSAARQDLCRLRRQLSRSMCESSISRRNSTAPS